MIEGRPTGDGRFIEDGALTWADPPLPLMWQKAGADGHDGDVVVGTIESITRQGDSIMGQGVLLDSAEASDVTPIIESGVLGLSARLDDSTEDIVPVDADGRLIPEGDPRLAQELGGPDSPVIEAQLRVSAARIRNLCVVSTPAFVECTIELLGDDGESAPDAPQEAPSDAAPAPAPTPAPVAAGACCLACQATGGSCAEAPSVDGVHEPPAAAVAEAQQFVGWRRSGRAGGSATAAARASDLAAGHPLTYVQVKRLFAFLTRSVAHREDAGWRRGDPGYPSPGRVAWAAHGGDAGFAWVKSVIERNDGAGALASYSDVATSLAASAASTAPPMAWFSDPHLDGPTSLTVTPDGRVYGHLAPWNSCHMSVQGRCLTPPHSASGYAHFLQGRVRTAEGHIIATGPVTVSALHADLALGDRAAIEHYEHTGAAVADVVAGEDAYGIWVAGAVRPGITSGQRLQLERSALSGDWRGVAGRHELVAALCVNTPGFPIVKARVASGVPTALVASGVVEADRRDRQRIPRRPSHDPRLEAAAEALAATIGRDRRALVAAMSAEVHG